jgi:hypothetical protein
MALVVEDGSQVQGANSYISVDDARAYASARGLTLPVSSADVEILLTKALDFIEVFRSQFQGKKTSSAQALQWPRTRVVIDGESFASDEIPEELRKAQAQLAIEAQTTELVPTGGGKDINFVKVEGAVEIHYVDGSGGSPQPEFTLAMKYLSPLFDSGGEGDYSLENMRG